MAARTVDGAPASLPLYVKAALPAVPLLGRLPGVRHHPGGDVPDTTLTRERVTTDMAPLAAYARVCGYGLRNELPPTYPHLAAFGLQLTLMTDTAFPFAPMGLVHVTNSITQHRPIGVDEEYDVSVHAANLRPHPRGRIVDLVSRASVDGDVVWEETSSYLSRGRRDDNVSSDSPLDGVDAPAGSTRWRLESDLGRRYGAVSGDRNPIHLYRLSAKALGFPRQIAHGMWTLAHALAALDGRLPESYRVDVEFRKPILLPGTAAFGADVAADTMTFGVTGDPKPLTHLVGRVGAL
ncbi:MAG: MaoC family dehydratase [Nocardioidaceae bacterium]